MQVFHCLYILSVRYPQAYMYIINRYEYSTHSGSARTRREEVFCTQITRSSCRFLLDTRRSSSAFVDVPIQLKRRAAVLAVHLSFTSSRYHYIYFHRFLSRTLSLSFFIREKLIASKTEILFFLVTYDREHKI